MQYEEFISELIEKARDLGFEDCEAYLSLSNNFEVEIFKNVLEKYEKSSISGLSFRGLYNGKMGYSYTEKIEKDVIDKLIDMAKTNAILIENEDKDFIFEGSKNYVNLEKVEIEQMSEEDKIDIAFKLEKYAEECDEKVEMVTAYVGDSESLVSLVNSKGLSLSNDNKLSYVYLDIVVKKDDEIREVYEIWAGKSLANLDLKKLAKKGVDKALFKLGSKSVKSDKYRVILTNETVATFLKVFCSMFYGEQVQKGFSILKNRVNDEIFSDKITLFDKGITENSIVKSVFDSEGVATRDVTLVEKGVLKGYLYNLKSAYKADVVSTGNGFRSGYKGGISTMPKNFYIENGDVSFEKMLDELQNGLIIDDIRGMHSGANAISGQFSLQASGKLVENGKIVSPVDDIVISDNFLDMFKKVTLVGNDFKFDLPSSNTCFGAPSLLVENLSVAGE
ncbi:MAG: TldD/PmbA family protein [Lachnospirales bacterium]